MKNKKQLQGGKLFNNAGKGKYTNKDCIENVIYYCLRERKHKDHSNELLTWGALGAPEWDGSRGVVEAFKRVQSAYTRKGTFGRYIDHEVYDFSQKEIAAIQEVGVDLDEVARQMAKDFFRDGTQVMYAVHNRNEKEKDIHVHFAVNTVNYKTNRKRRENKTDTKNRSERMNKIIAEMVRKSSD